MRTVLDANRPLSQDMALGGEIDLIKWSDLHFKEKIGTGGYAEVYRAELHGAVVAVKVFRVASSQIETMSELVAEVRHSLAPPFSCCSSLLLQRRDLCKIATIQTFVCCWA